MTQHFADILHANQPSPQVAFDRAIAFGTLSAYADQSNWAGNYMFMGRYKDGRLAFKDINTRSYVYVEGARV